MKSNNTHPHNTRGALFWAALPRTLCLIVALKLFQRTGTTFSLFMHFDSKSKAQALWGYKAVPIFKPKWPVTISDYFLHASLEDSDVSCRLKNSPFCNELWLLSLDILPVLVKTCFGKLFGFPALGEKAIKIQSAISAICSLHTFLPPKLHRRSHAIPSYLEEVSLRSTLSPMPYLLL